MIWLVNRPLNRQPEFRLGTPRGVHRLTALTVLLVGITTARTARPQVENAPPDPGDKPAAESPRAALDNPDVYVNDSFEASDALVKAQALAHRGRWADAAQLLQRAMDRAEHRLVRVSPDSYTGIRAHISNLIARWPQAGITEYRRLFESELESALKNIVRPRAPGEYLALFERYFAAAGAARLADTIGQLALEAGDLTLAEHVYSRVVETHPDAALHAPRYRAMLTVIAAMRGDPPQPTGEESAVKLRWMGQDRFVKEIVEEIRRSFRIVPSAAAPDEWPIFAGDPTRSRSTHCDIAEPGLLWRVDLWDTDDAGSEAGSPSSPTDRVPSSRDLTIFPTAWEGKIYLQWFREIVAVHRGTGSLAWRFGSNPRRGTGLDYLDDSPPGWDSVTVERGRVYASLPGEDAPYFGYESARAISELVCLDAGTGRVLWRVSQRSAEDPQMEISFDSSPLVRDDRVYVVGRRRRAFGFEDCYLYCLRAADGNVEYRTHLGSASTGTFGTRPATRTLPALDGDTIYVCTNLGSVAAVSVHSGDVRWLRLYERFRPDTAQALGRAARELDPWQFNPLIAAQGRVVCMPTDSARLLVLSTKDGALLWSIPTEELHELETLLGLRGDLLCGVGREVFCHDLTTAVTRWTAALPAGGPVFGRGLWADHELLIPRRQGLSRFRVTDGTRTDAPWDAQGEGGNLLALPDQLIAAGGGRIAAYVRKADIWKNFRERMAAAPKDPLPALELAEVALGAGDFSESLALLEEAVHRAERVVPPPEPPLAARLLDDAVRIAKTLSQRSLLEPQALDRLFEFAAQFASDAESNLRYRFAFAELFELQGQPARALRLYQQVLRDRSLRDASPVLSIASSKGGAPNRAGAVAQSRIALLLEQNGRSIFSAYDAEAKEWLASGQAAADAELLERVVEAFPNSEAAPRALIALGELLSREGRVDAAARHFARAFHRYPTLVDRPTLLRTIADTFERAGRKEHAYRWLTKAAREFPSASIEFQGRLLTFQQYRDRLGTGGLRVEPSRPAIRPPLTRGFDREFEGQTTLLVPSFGETPGSHWSRFFVRVGPDVRAFASQSGDEDWPEPAGVGAGAELLLARSDLALFATSAEVVALDARTGARRWTLGGPDRPGDDPGADWEGGGKFRAHSLQGDRLVSVRDDGRMSCVAVDSGKVFWSHSRRPSPAGRVRLMDPWVVFHTIQDGRAVLCLLDAETGEWIDGIPTDEKRSVEDLFPTLDGQIIVVTSQAIASYDAERRTRTWQTAVGSLRPASVLLDVDALYYCGEDGEVRKLDADDGRLLWQSERLMQRGEEDLTVQREGNALIISTTQSVSAVDSVDGMTLWRGTTPERTRLIHRAVGDSFVVAVDLADGLRPGRAAAYFYDHRNHSGVIPKDGGAPDLGPLSDVRAALVLDHAIVIQTAQTIRGYASP